MVLAASIFATFFLLGTICLAQFMPGFQSSIAPGGQSSIVPYSNHDNNNWNDNMFWKNYWNQNNDWNGNWYWNDDWNQNNNWYNSWYREYIDTSTGTEISIGTTTGTINGSRTTAEPEQNYDNNGKGNW